MMRCAILFCCFVFTASCYAQSTYKSGVMPQVNVSASLKNDWKFNVKLENRFLFFEGEMGKPLQPGAEWERADLEMVMVKTINTINALGGGYLVRNQRGVWSHRFIQQYTNSRRVGALKLVHRIRTDETFEQRAETRFRLRYRASMEIPLNGQVTDHNEFYLKINNEYLGTLQGDIIELEIRALLSLGYQLNDICEFESGVDYRAEDMLGGNTKNHFWLNFSCYISL